MKNKRLYFLLVFSFSLFSNIETLKAQNRLEQAKEEYKGASWVFMDAKEYAASYQLVESQKECIVNATSEKEYDQIINSMLEQGEKCPKFVGYTHPALQKEPTSALEMLVYTDKGERFARPFVAVRNVAKCGDFNILAIDFKDNEYLRNSFKDVIKKVEIIYIVVQPTSAILAKKQTEVAEAAVVAYQKITSQPEVKSNASAFNISLNKLIEGYPDFSSLKGNLISAKATFFDNNKFASKVSLEGSASTVLEAKFEVIDFVFADFGDHRDQAKAKEVYQNLIKQIDESSKCCCSFVKNVIDGSTTAWLPFTCGGQEEKFKGLVMEAIYMEIPSYDKNTGAYTLYSVFFKIYKM
ncbi:MAG: hypothetical protein V4547_15460 [Bacteroidota bacterium]